VREREMRRSQRDATLEVVGHEIVEKQEVLHRNPARIAVGRTGCSGARQGVSIAAVRKGLRLGDLRWGDKMAPQAQ
jgi:uncharacterized protein (DUF2345 family)